MERIRWQTKNERLTFEDGNECVIYLFDSGGNEGKMALAIYEMIRHNARDEKVDEK